MLRFVRLRFEVRVKNEGRLPKFFSPTLRGALGLNFRKSACVTHLEQCEPCLLRFQCPYARFFEPFSPPDNPFSKRLFQMPRPFALQVPPPANGPVLLKEGDLLSFRLTFWHQAETFLPYIVIAVQRMLEKGVGKGLTARLERVIAEVLDGEEEVFRADEGQIKTTLPTVSVDEVMMKGFEGVKRLRVRFVTPLRIDIGGKLQNPITFPSLIKSANERGRAVFWAYNQTEPLWDGKGLVKGSEGVKLVEGEQRWVDLTRYSRRQGEKLKVGGVIGYALFEGDELSPFLPLLRLMEWLQVGKLTTMGLGEIEVSGE